MSETARTIRTEWGPATLPLLECDACGNVAISDYAMGWLSVTSVATPMRKTLASLPDQTHFCGQACLVTYLTGTQA
jgi:hypothetical protein